MWLKLHERLWQTDITGTHRLMGLWSCAKQWHDVLRWRKAEINPTRWSSFRWQGHHGHGDDGIWRTG